MLTLLAGENSFEVAREIERVSADFDGEIQRVDGSALSIEELPNLFMGVTLFSEKRLIIVKELSLSKEAWSSLPEWLPRISDDVSIIFVEPKPDKRTKAYKELVKVVMVKDFPLWGERDGRLAESWVSAEMKQRSLEVDRRTIQELVERAGVNQWDLHHAIEKLALYSEITPRLVREVIEASPSENVFMLLDTALRGNKAEVLAMLRTLRTTDDPYMVFGLLAGQVFQLAALTVSDVPSAQVAKDIGAHPFALQKLAVHAKNLDRRDAKRIVSMFADADVDMKSTSIDPWLAIERALVTL